MNLKPIFIVVVALVIIGSIVMTVRSFQEARDLKGQIEELQKQSPPAVQEEVKNVVEEVGKLIALPEGENPTVATITDKDKLRDVLFFTKAENGDKVLLYVNNRKAYLYRPSIQKVMDVATLNLNTDQKIFAPKVALRDGTGADGLMESFEENLKKALPEAEVISRDNTKNNTFEETLVVDLTGAKRDEAQRIAVAVAGKVSSLPAGEAKPDGADFLIIHGSDSVKNQMPTASPARTTTSPASTTAPNQ